MPGHWHKPISTSKGLVSIYFLLSCCNPLELDDVREVGEGKEGNGISLGHFRGICGLCSPNVIFWSQDCTYIFPPLWLFPISTEGFRKHRIYIQRPAQVFRLSSWGDHMSQMPIFKIQVETIFCGWLLCYSWCIWIPYLEGHNLRMFALGPLFIPFLRLALIGQHNYQISACFSLSFLIKKD